MHVCILDADELSEKLTLIDEKLHETKSTGIYIQLFLSPLYANMYMFTMTKIQLECKTKTEVKRYSRA